MFRKLICTARSHQLSTQTPPATVVSKCEPWRSRLTQLSSENSRGLTAPSLELPSCAYFKRSEVKNTYCRLKKQTDREDWGWGSTGTGGSQVVCSSARQGNLGGHQGVGSHVWQELLQPPQMGKQPEFPRSHRGLWLRGRWFLSRSLKKPPSWALSEGQGSQ